jgi:hypothetical protein
MSEPTIPDLTDWTGATNAERCQALREAFARSGLQPEQVNETLRRLCEAEGIALAACPGNQHQPLSEGYINELARKF